MADKKKHKAKRPDYSEYVEMEMGPLGVVRTPRAGMSDWQWEAVKKQGKRVVKVNDPDELKQQAEMEGGDHILMQDPAGNQFVVPRGNLSDSEWEKKRKTAREQYGEYVVAERTGGVTVRETGDGTPEDVVVDRGAILEALKNKSPIAGGNLTPRDHDILFDLVKSDPNKAVDFVEERINRAKVREKGAAEKKERDAAEKAEEASLTPSGGTSPLGKFASMVKDASLAAAPKERVREMPEIDLTEPGLDPKGSAPKLNQMAAKQARMGGIASETAFSEEGEPAITPNPPLDPQGSNPELNALAQKQANTRFYGQGGVVDPGADESQRQMTAGERIASEAKGLGGALFDTVTGRAGPLAPVRQGLEAGIDAVGAIGSNVLGVAPPPGAAGPVDVDPLDAGVPAAPVGAPVPPDAGMAPQGIPTGAGISMGMSSQGTRAGAPAQLSDQTKALKDAFDAQAVAQAGAADLESQALATKARLLAEQEREMLAADARRQDVEAARAERMRQAQTGLAALQSKFAELESQSVDPNRFWNNKDAGQKAMAVVAGALFGFTGQGMQWLQRLDSLVEQDIQQQFNDLRRKQGLVGQQVDVQNNIVALARQQGLDDIEAYHASKAMMLEKYALKMEQVAASTGSDMAKAKAAESSAVLRQKAAMSISDMDRQTQLASAQIAKMRQDMYLDRQSFALKAQAAATKGDKLEQIRGPQAFQIADLQDAIKTSRNMSESFKQKASGFLSKISALDPTGTTGASEYAARRNVAVQLVGRALEGGVLREGDIVRYQEMIPKAGDLRGQEKWDQLIKELEQRLSTTVNTLEAAGFDTARVKEQANEVLRPRVSFTPSR